MRNLLITALATALLVGCEGGDGVEEDGGGGIGGGGGGPLCGDGLVEGDEICDDGYTDACGSCNAACTGPGAGSICGDGEVCLQNEACDDGDKNDTGPCNANCSGPGTADSCGDGEVDGREVCDDGYADNCGSCSADCTAPGAGSTCGDGQHCPETEACDDGFTDPCGSCNADCSGAGSGSVCGDGVVCDEIERCDDGDTLDSGSCNATCSGPGAGAVCGNGAVEGAEICDDGFTDACGTCNATCSAAGSGSVCGDGVVCDETESCDDGDALGSGSCNATCSGPGSGSACGNGVTEGSEACDDGHNDACGSCNATCTAAGSGSTCGDGERCPETEACDDGFTDACGSCNAACSAAGSGSTCGDGVRCPETEACDDDYADACGSCNATCTAPGSGSTCGDGARCPETEACDDGHNDACGSCNATCTAAGSGSSCGDGVLCPETETCDDGYTDACGSCNADCTWAGYGSVCGNGSICAETEQCDSSNVGGWTCASLGFASGLPGCDPQDCTLDPRPCTVSGSICGDGLADGHEICDGPIPYTCADYDPGFGTGTPSCLADCTASFSPCQTSDLCAVLDLYDNTWCDPCHLKGGSLDGDCSTYCGGDGLCADFWSPWGGDFTCALAGLGTDPDCTTCGNGVADTGEGEWCDGWDLVARSCQTFGFSGGALACNADCTPDFSACTHHPGSVCGDGVVTGLEQCDTALPLTLDCADLSGFGVGNLACSSLCTWDFSGCSNADWCLNNAFYNDGTCDPCSQLGGTPDPDCAALCGGGNACADYYSWNVAAYACETEGYARDPDCPCGNGVRDAALLEYCDGTDLGGQDCRDFGFAGGTLSCDGDCVPELDACLR